MCAHLNFYCNLFYLNSSRWYWWRRRKKNTKYGGWQNKKQSFVHIWTKLNSRSLLSNVMNPLSSDWFCTFRWQFKNSSRTKLMRTWFCAVGRQSKNCPRIIQHSKPEFNHEIPVKNRVCTFFLKPIWCQRYCWS